MAKKAGRNVKSTQNLTYKAENRREKNKVRKLVRTLKQQPNNLVVREALKARGQGDVVQEIVNS